MLNFSFKFIFLSISLLSLIACNPLSYLNKNEAPVPQASPSPSPSPLPPTPPPAVPASPPPVMVHNNANSLIGDYQVKGTNPGGRSNYSGSAKISAGDEPNTYKINWRVGTIYEGIGKLEGNSLNVKWGTPTNPVGNVMYTLEPGGILKGVWYTFDKPNSLGSEILTPR